MVWLSDEAWDQIQSSVPIVCVDLVPVRLDSLGEVSAVGLIRRRMPESDDIVWCVLGGRINHGETVRAAVLRHLGSTVSGAVFDVPPDPQPSYVFQWFPSSRDDDGVAYGIDPRRHSVGLCFVVPMTGEPVVVEGGEALQFAWFDLGRLGEPGENFWPGTVDAVRGALGGLSEYR